MNLLSNSFNEIVNIIGGEQLSNSDNFQIKELLIDSRRLLIPENTLFFALVTSRNDGHRYIEELYRKGVRKFIISETSFPCLQYPEAGFILVGNVLYALQKLAAHHRRQFNYPVIGITGSNGKTIVKEWLFQLMFKDKNIVRSPVSYNSQIGVPLSVWQMSPDNELAIFEAGISQPGEMQALANIIEPTIGIFTNIGSAHSENFINLKEKLSEKLKLFANAELLIYRQDSLFDEMFSQSPLKRKIKTFTWGRNQDAEVWIRSVKRIKGQTNVNVLFKEQEIKIVIPFTDYASVENAMHCFTTMLALGFSPEIASNRLLQLQSLAMRLDLKEGINQCSIINDSYSSDLNSLSIALDFLNQQKQHTRNTVILSDILQSGKSETDLYSEVATLLSRKHIQRVIGIGVAISRQRDKFKMEKAFYPTTEDFIRQYSFSNFYKESILIKGARIFEFEKINRALQQKAHETVLEINLNALIYNLNYYRSKLNNGTKLMAMVKAFSYGSGSYEIASTLQFHHADYLTVAYADEGIELRKAGIMLPIMVMNPEEHTFDAMIQYQLEPEIYSFKVFGLLENALTHTHNKVVNVHIKLDTGMHRLGFDEKDLLELISKLQSNTNIHCKSVFTHLAAADDPKEDGFTRLQIDKFRRMSDVLIQNVNYPMLRHILNSVGIIRFPDDQFDMVRLGIGLYGIATGEEDKIKLQNVTTLKTIISQIKKIPAGETVGYNRRWKAKTESIIATIPIGYADGLSRRLGNGKGFLMVNNHLVPIIGNICMDMCMIDITHIDAREGDEVIVFGEKNSITELAKAMDTIPYEILTSISRRVKRIYYQE